MQRREMLLRANRLLFRDIISKILTECLQTPEQSLERWIPLEAECFLEKALQQTQIIFYRLEANNSTKIKSYKWSFIYNGYSFCTRMLFSTEPKPVPENFLISFH